MVLPDGTDADVFALAEDDLEAAVQVFHVRDGRVRGQRGWVVEKVEDVTTADLVEQLLLQVYGDAGREAVPREVLVPAEPPGRRPRSRRCSAEVRGARVAVRVPAARRQALAARDRRPQRRPGADPAQDPPRRRPHDAFEGAAGDPGRARLPEAPLRIECYDVSNIQGQHVVASMVVFEDGLARKSEYRRFTVRGTDGQDDVAVDPRGDHAAGFRRYLEDRETIAGARPGRRGRRGRRRSRGRRSAG